MIGAKRSRVQSRGQVTARKSNGQAQRERQQRGKVALNGHKFNPDGNVAGRAPKLQDLINEKKATSNKPGLETTLYHDALQDGVPETAPFSKKRVQSVKEIADNGQFQSVLRPKVTPMTDATPLAGECAIEDDSDNWPDSSVESLIQPAPAKAKIDGGSKVQHQGQEPEPAAPAHESSFSLQVPVYEIVNGRLELQRRDEPAPSRSPAKKAVSKPKPLPKRAPNPSSTPLPGVQRSSSLLYTISTLFAGRKPSKSTTPSPSPPYDPHEGISWSPPRPATPPSSPPAPRLTHKQTIPGPKRQRPFGHSTLRDFRYNVEPARKHRYTGYSVLEPSRFTPTRVTKGFDVPTTEQRKKHDNRGIMDREGDIWTNWYEMEEAGREAAEKAAEEG
jgi:hypothetical protein